MWKNNDRIIDSVLIVLNCSMARYNGRLHCIVGVLPTCYKRKAATYFYPPGGTGLFFFIKNPNLTKKKSGGWEERGCTANGWFVCLFLSVMKILCLVQLLLRICAPSLNFRYIVRVSLSLSAPVFLLRSKFTCLLKKKSYSCFT